MDGMYRIYEFALILTIPSIPVNSYRDSSGRANSVWRIRENMSEHGKCPMGKHPWLATFLVVAFFLVFAAHKLGFL